MMKDYKPCLFNKNYGYARVVDSAEWNVYVKSVPFKLFPELKDLPSRDWYDESGNDEYIPPTPFYKSYDIDCEFVYVGAHGTANDEIKGFLTYLAENGDFKIYDTYTGIGRDGVRFVGYSEDVLYRREGQNDVVVFKVKLRVNNPNSDIKLTKL